MTTYRIWPATSGPGSTLNEGFPYNLGIEFYVSAAAQLTKVHYWRATTDQTPDNIRVYRVDSDSAGTVVAEVTSPTASGTGWQTDTLATPVTLVVNQRYRVVYHSLHYAYTGSYWIAGGAGENGITNGILVAPSAANATGNDQGANTGGALAFPTNSFLGGNYWADVTVDDAPVNGALAATLPALTASLAGASTVGTLDAELPALTAALSGALPIDGALAAQLPAATSDLSGIVSDTSGGGFHARRHRSPGGTRLPRGYDTTGRTGYWP